METITAFMKLSIIIPVYNAEKHLANCLQSVCHQDLPKHNYEVIVINDGSTDLSSEIILQFQQRYGNIVFIDQENKGVSAARNAGLSTAQGEYITFVDADDEIENNSLKQIVELLVNEDLDVFYPKIDTYSENGERLNSINVGEKYDEVKSGILQQRRTFTPTFYRKELIGTIRFNENISFGEDTVFNSQVQSLADRVMFSDIPYYKYTVLQNSLSKQGESEKVFRGFLNAIREVRNFQQENFQENPDAKVYFDKVYEIFVTRILELNVMPKWNRTFYIDLISLLKEKKLLHILIMLSEKYPYVDTSFRKFKVYQKFLAFKLQIHGQIYSAYRFLRSPKTMIISATSKSKNKSKSIKIAILTQQLGFNYGGIIQNYALQRILTNLGHRVITINRGEENPNSKLKIFLNRCKLLILRYVFNERKPIFLDYKKISRTNSKFISQNIKLSPLIHTTPMLVDYFSKSKFDAVLVGSDQVWRPNYSPNILNFYLDFLQSQNDLKKISYAASFGTDKWEYSEIETQICTELIQQFQGVSVREDSGIELCAKHLNRNDVEHVLDPAFLLSAEDYSDLIGPAKSEVGLFTYFLDESHETLKFVEFCAKTLNLTLHKNQAKLSPYDIKISKIQDYMIPPIEGWLKGFRDAEFILTDSFHGTVFSILNKKAFFVIVNSERGAARFESILKQLGLEDRLIYNLERFNLSNLKNEINYQTVYSKLEELKKDSLLFLNTHLSGWK
ncbi:glycosyltransferase [Chryseobacterium koreense]|uniref:glycosyltransferase n=1 Tax=Chryseobacterium koreense TaxID=232216 RepID=UPI00065A93AD|nr:glycosyltransferase [Chryseobacterium koreense]MBB5333547.1 glycosyltransferase involved in cell wall biosynthesis [Chryseobacterium koreense]